MYLTLNNLSQTIDKLFSDKYFSDTGHHFSRSSIVKTDNGYILEMLLPGFNNENLNVEIIEGDLLKINGEIKTKNKSYVINESYKLSSEIDTSMVNAEIKDGILNVTLPFLTEKRKSKKIQLL